MLIVTHSDRALFFIEIEHMTLFALSYCSEEMATMAELDVVAIADAPLFKPVQLLCSNIIADYLVR